LIAADKITILPQGGSFFIAVLTITVKINSLKYTIKIAMERYGNDEQNVKILKTMHDKLNSM
jgi:hypothetical protein